MEKKKGIDGLADTIKDPKYKMSEERLEELKEELSFLQTVREKEVAELIKEARSFGDLSENSEYDEAKTEQGKLYAKIAEIKNLVENAEIVIASEQTDRVGIGSKVTVRDMGFGTEDVYEIVGSQEADPINGRISDDSPLGKGLMDKERGESIEIDAPAGVQKFQIVDIA
ncbi:MAG: transcription elongation factor GreA [Oscillospiraceae bacterium]|nr:transcription elongation factor GreA [Oscillospiraceae bacterium]